MLFGMDCLVQEVHIPRDVLVSEFDGRFGRSSAIAMGLRRCAVICNYGWSPGPSTQQDWQKAGPYDVLEPAWRGISGICRKRQLHCFTNKVHMQDEEQGALRLCRLRVLVIDWRCWGFWLNMPCSFCVCVHAPANLYRLWASNVMLCKTSLDEYSTFLDMSLAQWCCSRFQQSILQWFLLQGPGQIGFWCPIRLSKDWMCSSGKCWQNTVVDDLMKLIAWWGLWLRCFGFWFGGVSVRGNKDVVDLNTNPSGKSWSSLFLFLRVGQVPSDCHCLSSIFYEVVRDLGMDLPKEKQAGCPWWSIEAAGCAAIAHCREDELIWRKTRRPCCL